MLSRKESDVDSGYTIRHLSGRPENRRSISSVFP